MTATVEPSTTPEGLRADPYCPQWCTKDHLQDFADGATVAQAREHETGGPGAVLPELRNILGEQILRPGGGAWNLTKTQDTARDKPTIGVPTINLHVSDAMEHTPTVTLRLTAGDALELAAALAHDAHKIILS